MQLDERLGFAAEQRLGLGAIATLRKEARNRGPELPLQIRGNACPVELPERRAELAKSLRGSRRALGREAARPQQHRDGSGRAIARDACRDTGLLEMGVGREEVVPVEMRPTEREVGADRLQQIEPAVTRGELERLRRELRRAGQSAADRLEERKLADAVQVGEVRRLGQRQLDRLLELRLGELDRASREQGGTELRECGCPQRATGGPAGARRGRAVLEKLAGALLELLHVALGTRGRHQAEREQRRRRVGRGARGLVQASAALFELAALNQVDRVKQRERRVSPAHGGRDGVASAC